MSAWIEAQTGLVFRDPWMLLCLLLLPLAYWARRRRWAPAFLFVPGKWGLGLPPSWRSKVASWLATLSATGILLLGLALARPATRESLPLQAEGIDLFLCLDTSSSMASKDMHRDRTRLAIAKDSASRFLDGRPQDRIGLISFARFPDLLCPPTADHAALQEALRGVHLVENDGPEDATGLGAAAASAAYRLRQSLAKSKVAILLTDGEENVATAQTPHEIAPAHAAQLCREFGVKVYAIAVGVGSPKPGGGWASLDTRPLRLLAEKTGGAFYEAREAGTLESIYKTIDSLEKTAYEKPRERFQDRFFPFLIVASTLLLASVLLASAGWEASP